MDQLKPLIIGDLTAKLPIIQGGMGVGISLSSLAGTVAREGGVGLISAAQIGFREPDFAKDSQRANLRALGKEFKKARAIAPDGVIGFNIMVATKEYEKYVRTAVEAGADIIVSGAGLPVSLPEYTKGSRTKIAPIVSSEKSASVICKMWDRKFKTAPDLVVIEGPLAGGHLGFTRESLHELGADTEDVDTSFKKEEYEAEIQKIISLVREYAKKYGRYIPVVTAGGIYTHEDVMHQLSLGADGVQVATRFVTTSECDAPQAYKDAYLQAGKEDIVIVKSPVGMPGRAVRNHFLKEAEVHRIPVRYCYNCLAKCDKATIPYCITEALVNAAMGNEENALLFCGSNAWRADHMETVHEVLTELCHGRPEK